MSLRTALVSGASRGLGAVIARRLAADGWAVAVNHRSSAADAEAVVATIRSGGAGRRPPRPTSPTRRTCAP